MGQVPQSQPVGVHEHVLKPYAHCSSTVGHALPVCGMEAGHVKHIHFPLQPQCTAPYVHDTKSVHELPSVGGLPGQSDGAPPPPATELGNIPVELVPNDEVPKDAVLPAEDVTNDCVLAVPPAPPVPSLPA